MRDYKYGVYLVTAQGREEILAPTSSMWRARNVARRLKERPGRKVQIERDNRVLPGGRAGLDKACLEDWLERNAS